MTQFAIDRRSLFKGTGALVVSFAIPGGLAEAEIGSAVKPPLAPDQLDSWLAIKTDGDVVAYFGKMDMGQGVDVAIAQIVSEELDVPLERVSMVMGDTAWTVNQGGASGSTGVQKGGIALRNAAAETRRVLVEMAAQRLGVPAGRLEVTDGIVSVSNDPARKVSYGELIGGRYFDLPMKWNGKLGNDLVAEGQDEAQAARRLQDCRPIAAAFRCSGQGLRHARLRHRHQGAGDAARPHAPPAGRGGGADRRRRRLGARHSWRPGRT